MTLTQLLAIYEGSLDVSHIAALEAVYTQGYCSGAGITVTASTPSQAVRDASPATIVKLKQQAVR